MNENPLPPEPETPVPATRPKPPAAPSSPGFGLMFGLGVLIIIISIVLCVAAQSPAPLFLGALSAFVSLFFEGYRGIFVGYIATVGLVLLATIIYCSNHPFNV